MRIGLISDTHIPEAREDLWPQLFEAFRDADLILHAGDIHDLRVIDELSEVAPIYVARGNGDDGSGGRDAQPEDDRLRDAWSLELGGVAVGLTHVVPIPEMPPQLTLERAIGRLFPERRPEVLIYGDTHVEAIDEIDGVLCINPGSPTYPHNLNTQLGTIGFLEIEAGRASASIWQLADEGVHPFDWNKWRR
ncbi:MAG: YfcE family phosphodiesterase [Myxococcota bacterium]